MSVQSEITRLEAAKAAIADAIAEKGVDVPDGTMLDEMGALIAAIEAGGGLDISVFSPVFTNVECGSFVFAETTQCSRSEIALSVGVDRIQSFMACVYTKSTQTSEEKNKKFFAFQYASNAGQTISSAPKNLLHFGVYGGIRTNGAYFSHSCGASYDENGDGTIFSGYPNKYSIVIGSTYVDGQRYSSFSLDEINTPTSYYLAGDEYYWMCFYNEVEQE